MRKLFSSNELNRTYLFSFFRFFAIYLVHVLIPVYLFQKGFDIKYIAGFFLILRLTHLASLPLVASNFGYRKIKASFLINLSLFFLIIFYLGLRLIKPGTVLFLFLAILYGINNSLFWYGYHLIMARFTQIGLIGQEIALAFIFMNLGSALAPFAGGLLTEIIGFDSTIILSLVSLVLACLIGFNLKLDVPPEKINIDYLKKREKRTILSFLADGFEVGVIEIIWPIIAFLYLKNLTNVGLTLTLTYLAGSLLNIIFGHNIDLKKLKLLKASIFGNFTIWLVKIFSRQPFLIYLLDSLQGISRSAINLLIDFYSYRLAKNGLLNTEIFLREISILSGIVFFYLIVYFLNLPLKQLLIFALLANPFYLLLFFHKIFKQ